MKKVKIYLKRKTHFEDRILFSDGVSDIWILKSLILSMQQIKNNDYEVVLPLSYAMEIGII